MTTLIEKEIQGLPLTCYSDGNPANIIKFAQLKQSIENLQPWETDIEMPSATDNSQCIIGFIGFKDANSYYEFCSQHDKYAHRGVRQAEVPYNLVTSSNLSGVFVVANVAKMTHTSSIEQEFEAYLSFMSSRWAD